MVDQAVIAAAAASEVISWVAAVVSIILALFAIWQATTFFKWSHDAQSAAEESAREIQASVAKLETLFDRLYADTFGMMRDTVADMRKHVWYAQDEGSDELDGSRDARLEALRSELRGEVSLLAAQVGDASSQVGSLEARVGELIDRAVDESREAALEHPMSSRHARALLALKEASESGRAPSVLQLATELGEESPRGFIDAIFSWRKDGQLTWPGPENALSHAAPITLTDAGRDLAERVAAARRANADDVAPSDASTASNGHSE